MLNGGNIVDSPLALNLGPKALAAAAPQQVLILQASITELENVICIEREQHSQLVVENGTECHGKTDAG